MLIDITKHDYEKAKTRPKKDKEAQAIVDLWETTLRRIVRIQKNGDTVTAYCEDLNDDIPF